MSIGFGSITITEKTKEFIADVLDRGVIGQSEYIELFEQELARFLGVKHCVAVSNGTTADTIALAVLKYNFPHKTKVAVPALTFIAQINAIYYNHLEPVFYDALTEPKITEDLLCAFPCHLLGVPANIPKGVPVIEDACEAFGSKVNGKYCGTLGDMGTFSFFPSHTLSTGEGGAIVTDNDEYAALARRLRNHGKTDGKDFKFDVIGFNGKMNSMEAAVGLSLIPELPVMIAKRHNNFMYLGGSEQKGHYVVPHGYAQFSLKRDEKIKELKAKGIDARRYFSCIPTQEKAYEFLGYKLGDFPNAERIGNYGYYVPCHQSLTDEELKLIKENI